MFENIEKSLTSMLSAIGVKKKICSDETMVPKPSTYNCIPKYISGTTLEI